MIKNIYPYKVKFIIYEILYLLLAPYYLFKWKKELKKNYQNIISLLDSDIDLGAVSKYSVFNNYSLLDRDLHMLLSLINFKKNTKFKKQRQSGQGSMPMSNSHQSTPTQPTLRSSATS